MISNFTEYFAGFTTGAIALRLLFAAVLGCIIGLERATKHHPAGMRTFALVCLGAAASAIVNIYLGTACQRDRLPRRGDDHHHGQKPGARTYDGSRAVDNCDAGDHAGLRDVRDQSHIVRTYLQHDVRHCTDQPCTGEIQPLHRIVYGDR